MTQLNECLLLVTGIYQMKLFTCYDVLFIYFHGSDSFTNLYMKISCCQMLNTSATKFES